MLPLLLAGDAKNYRDFAIHHSMQGKWAIRRGKWKLLLHAGSGGNVTENFTRGIRFNYQATEEPQNGDTAQLYDMDVDPFETTNRFTEFPEIVRELKTLCITQIENGRSTPGSVQQNELDGSWKQLEELAAL